MTRRLPLLPTLIVAAAVAAMIALGVWQLQRLKWKESLLASYQTALTMNSDVPWPADADLESVLFRHSHLTCFSPSQDAPVAGSNIDGQPGWAHVFTCHLTPSLGDPTAKVVLGWSIDPSPRVFRGGRLRGVIGPSGRLVVDPDLARAAGLRPNFHPDPSVIPNNHLSYAIQWFLFALTAVVIYVLALRKRWREQR